MNASMITESELALIAGENPENSIIQRLVEGYRYACRNIKAECRLEVASEMEHALTEEINVLLGRLALEKTANENAKFELQQLRDKLRQMQGELVRMTQGRITDLEKMNGALREEIMRVRQLYLDLNNIVADYRRRYG